MNWPLLFLSLDIGTIVCLVIFGARALLARPRQLSAQLIALIAFNSICHVVLSRYEYRYWIPAAYQFNVRELTPALNLARNLTPGLFMMLCFTMFADSRHFLRWLVGLFGLQMLLELSAYLPIAQDAPLEQFATRIAPALLQTVFTAFALYWTAANWQADLVETRRRNRAVVLAIIGLDIIGQSLLLRVAIDQNTIANYHAHLAFVATNFLIILLILIRLGDTELVELLQINSGRIEPRVPPVCLSSETEAELRRLRTLMEDERIYRKLNLSLKDLARLVGLPEYRLRKLIHKQLGFPNFNTFLHHYRIAEACGQLGDPAMRRTPILTIALSTGYQSINTFNRAFREVMGMTPSEYRSREQASVSPEKSPHKPHIDTIFRNREGSSRNRQA